eukprot:13397153-Alexandrium_andersonii.AAC.2
MRDFCCKTEIFAVSCAAPVLKHAAAQAGKRASASKSACAHAGPAHEATLQRQPTFAAQFGHVRRIRDGSEGGRQRRQHLGRGAQGSRCSARALESLRERVPRLQGLLAGAAARAELQRGPDGGAVHHVGRERG